MKYIFVFFIMLSSCDLDRPSSDYINVVSEQTECNNCFDTVEYDGCEYIYLRRYGSVCLEHKGNCKNPIHD